tara:strand:+ start:1630 stop:1815 length:186 start_codon:yes stop_codon:yes gene_type:complete
MLLEVALSNCAAGLQAGFFVGYAVDHNGSAKMLASGCGEMQVGDEVYDNERIMASWSNSTD